MTFKVARPLVVFSAVLTTIGCDRFTKQVATKTIAGEPDRSSPLRTGIFDMADLVIMPGAGLIVAVGLRQGHQSMAVAGTRDEHGGGAARFLARWRRLPR